MRIISMSNNNDLSAGLKAGSHARRQDKHKKKNVWTAAMQAQAQA